MPEHQSKDSLQTKQLHNFITRKEDAMEQNINDIVLLTLFSA